MLRRWCVCMMLCALVLAGCGAGSTDAPADVPAVPAAEGDAPAVVAPPAQRLDPAGEVERVGAFDPEAGGAPEPTATQEPTATLAPDPTEALEEPDDQDVDEPGAADEVEAPVDAPTGAEETAAPEASEEPTEAPTATRSPVQAPVIPVPATQPPAQVVSTSALVVLDDETPAPPLTVIVSTNRAFEGYRYRLSGLMRNDAQEPYAGLWMNATFFRDDGSRYGPVRVNVQCPILEPGESCPWLLEATDKGITQVMLHPDGHPVERHTVPVEVRGVRHYQDALGYVHITGTVYNPNPVTVRDVTITGVLIDGAGEIVETGVDLLVQPIEAGASAPFEVLVRYASYVRYELFVQALPR